MYMCMCVYAYVYICMCASDPAPLLAALTCACSHVCTPGWRPPITRQNRLKVSYSEALKGLIIGDSKNLIRWGRISCQTGRRTRPEKTWMTNAASLTGERGLNTLWENQDGVDKKEGKADNQRRGESCRQVFPCLFLQHLPGGHSTCLPVLVDEVRGTCDLHPLSPSCCLSCLWAPSGILGPWPPPTRLNPFCGLQACLVKMAHILILTQPLPSCVTFVSHLH